VVEDPFEVINKHKNTSYIQIFQNHVGVFYDYITFESHYS